MRNQGVSPATYSFALERASSQIHSSVATIGQNALAGKFSGRNMPSAKTRTDADDEAKSKLAGNRPKRCTESRTLESPAFLDFIERLRNNTLECDAGGKVLRLKRFISANSGPKTLHAVLDALEENTTVEALYIQNFESGFFDEHLVRLAEVLRLKRIWCLNVGENFRTSLPAWRRFCEDLKDTAVSHMYASEHHFIGTDVKHKMKAVIRETRNAQPPVAHHSLEVIMECGNMWYNPKLPKWARELKGGAAALAERQQAASADSAACGRTAKPRGDAFGGERKRAFRDGKRTIVQTAAGAAHAALEHSKRKRQEKLRRERAAAKKRDDADAVSAEKNKPLVEAAREKQGGSALVGWRVRVFWKAENAWFHGVVKAFDVRSGKHVVAYDDGDEQTLALRGSTAAIGFLRAPRRRSGASAEASAEASAKPASANPSLAPARRSARVPKRRAESPPPPPGGLRGSHGIRAAATARRLSQALAAAPKRARSASRR